VEEGHDRLSLPPVDGTYSAPFTDPIMEMNTEKSDWPSVGSFTSTEITGPSPIPLGGYQIAT
jgi:hypothetical protein